MGHRRRPPGRSKRTPGSTSMRAESGCTVPCFIDARSGAIRMAPSRRCAVQALHLRFELQNANHAAMRLDVDRAGTAAVYRAVQRFARSVRGRLERTGRKIREDRAVVGMHVDMRLRVFVYVELDVSGPDGEFQGAGPRRACKNHAHVAGSDGGTAVFRDEHGDVPAIRVRGYNAFEIADVNVPALRA